MAAGKDYKPISIIGPLSFEEMSKEIDPLIVLAKYVEGPTGDFFRHELVQRKKQKAKEAKRG